MHLSFLDYLRTGELPPIRFGATRAEILRLLGPPTNWVSKDDPLFLPPRRDYWRSESISFGSLTFTFDKRDALQDIMIALALECAYPPGSLFFPGPTTSIHEIAELMRGQNIPFEDTSYQHDGTELRTASGVVIVACKNHGAGERIFYAIQNKCSFKPLHSESCNCSRLAVPVA